MRFCVLIKNRWTKHESLYPVIFKTRDAAQKHVDAADKTNSVFTIFELSNEPTRGALPSNKTREGGVYWVRDLSTWDVAEWNPSRQEWYVCGSGVPYIDDDFLEIDERRIVRGTERITISDTPPEDLRST